MEENPDEPETFADWVDLVIKRDNSWRQSRGLKTGTSLFFSSSSASNNNSRSHYRDPYAMDVDVLSIADRDLHNKNQTCFHCAKKGHRIKDCRSKKAGRPPIRPTNESSNNPWRNQTSSNNPFANRSNNPFQNKTSTADAARNIRSMIAEYTEEEQTELYQQLAQGNDDANKDF